MIYLLSEKRLKADFLNDNIASELILPSIQTAQDIFLRQTLGDSLLDRICNMIREDELQEPYKTLLDEYIIIYLEYLAMAELCIPSTFKLGNIGVAQAYDNNVNTQTIQNVKYLESYYKQKASFYENRLTTFIQQHCNLFPEYRDTTTVTTAQESTLQCGIFLGGTSRKKIINNNSNNTNTEVGNYVRYDKAQNLSELEKAQARENIGVSANGDIVVDLENYYTKDEVFNKTETNAKLAPYITTNEVNLRLNSYYDKNTVNNLLDNLPIPEATSELVKDDVYTKQQTDTAIQNAIDNIDIPDTSNFYDKNTVNNLLDNLPIPEYTSELIKDDVYTKSEVYNKSEVDIKIANVSSGGSVDLSNYYNKQETESLIENIDIPTKTSELELDNVYSKTQVDTLISNVPTFSGDYNDLSNKPSIYTQNEIDTLISNINEFSGDYNDLTNKPDVYTKSQTDTLIQTAVNGIETFSGNYNDLTNKPTLFSGSYTDLTDKPTIPTDTAQLTKSDIYTKAETFTRQEIVDMINEINYSDINNTPTLSTVATSGSYTDLENKPTIPTATSQLQLDNVYNKSEIDLQFESVNTTLGNINNLLETI